MGPSKDTAGNGELPAGSGRRGVIGQPDLLEDITNDLDIKVEEFREDGHLVVRAEMPGIDPDNDIEIVLTDHTLLLRVERRPRTQPDGRKVYRSEFRYGSFSRSVQLPVEVTDGDVQAIYDQGILDVRIPVDGDDVEAGTSPT